MIGHREQVAVLAVNVMLTDRQHPTNHAAKVITGDAPVKLFTVFVWQLQFKTGARHPVFPFIKTGFKILINVGTSTIFREDESLIFSPRIKIIPKRYSTRRWEI